MSKGKGVTINIQELNKKVKEVLTKARTEVIQNPLSFFKRHLYESPLFKQYFGLDYRDFQVVLTKGLGIEEHKRIVKSLHDRSMVHDIVVDESGVIIDGGSRALYFLSTNEPVHVKILPIKCEESIENFIACVLIALDTLRAKGRTDDLRQLIELFRPGFSKFGIDVLKVFDMELSLSTLTPSVIPTVKKVKKMETVQEEVRRWIEEICTNLNLPETVKSIAFELYENVSILDEVFKLIEEKKLDRKSASFLTAIAYIYYACKFHCMGSGVLRRVISFSPIGIRVVGGDKKRQIITILSRKLIERGYTFEKHERMCIDAISRTFPQLGGKFVDFYSELTKCLEYEILRKNIPSIPDRVLVMIRIFLKKYNIPLTFKDVAEKLNVSEKEAVMFRKKVDKLIKEAKKEILEIKNRIAVEKDEKVINELKNKLNELEKYIKALNELKNLL